MWLQRQTVGSIEVHSSLEMKASSRSNYNDVATLKCDVEATLWQRSANCDKVTKS